MEVHCVLYENYKFMKKKEYFGISHKLGYTQLIL